MSWGGGGANAPPTPPERNPGKMVTLESSESNVVLEGVAYNLELLIQVGILSI